MYKIIYTGKKNNIDISKVSSSISSINNCKISLVKVNDLDEATNSFFDGDSLILLLIEENLDGFENFIKEMKNDESFKFLPVILILEENKIENRKKYFSIGVDSFLDEDFDDEELILICSSIVRNQIKIQELSKQLGEVSEKNITKALQLDLIRKFIPLTVWEKSASLAEGQDLEIPEEEQELSIIFGDLQSFTTISEKIQPEEVIQMLNGIFNIVTQVVYQNFGDIDKFIGDAFLAVFRHPEMALLSAVAIQTSLKLYNDIREIDDMPVALFRMGINFGKVIRGSVGGTIRYDNTLIGDPINTAQRLESMSPPGGILASKSLLSQINFINIEELDIKSYNLKGKNKIIEAAIVYDYIVNNEKIMDELFKIRNKIEKEININEKRYKIA
ncbi:MAG: hypothetical protein A2086_00255 [Spirochaetes bacterium GWD1_27_9]|nr:MAG: hypothetical protein A2Z98_09390 [Spirochaetes bacterium GWB1_27_13]OHD26858.1 MAG: hypothetical protein A2Y34_13580 [Spirochaetes bacterium GWC1_27_15]OHD43003.1 MAG: hypothetical protein A2086_00255 [Spirochaetes bacterium GWD1_27_9]